MTKLVLALALAFAMLATVPASAGPYCQEETWDMAAPAASGAGVK